MEIKLMPESKRKLVEIPISISTIDLVRLIFARPQKVLIDIEYTGNPKIYEVSLRSGNEVSADDHK
jgi:hypothetical protein